MSVGIEFVKAGASIALGLNPVTSLILAATEKAIKKSDEITENGNIEALKDEAMRQEISLKMAREQARVSQEIAIARRIDTAEEVSIEEYYDTSGEGGIGLKSTEAGISLGINGSGKQVVKRVYKFKGWHAIELVSDNNLVKSIESDK